MDTADYLKYLAEVIHTVVLATVDDRGLPVTAAVDMMDSDGESLYFLTAKGKSLYDRLVKRGFVALTGLKGNSTLSSVAVSLRGKTREVGPEPLERLIEKNPYMKSIYPTAQSRKALTVFEIYEGVGEWFDLSKNPIERATFTFGGAEDPSLHYFITKECTDCGVCYSVCPQRCINLALKPAVIEQEHCLHCGNCFRVCPVNAIVKRKML